MNLAVKVGQAFCLPCVVVHGEGWPRAAGRTVPASFRGGAAGGSAVESPLATKDFAMNGWKKIMSNCRGCANLSLQFTAWNTVR
jgi:hypothetical protein